jgi:RNA polymerase sigma-70 factor, ECF subfamily
MGGRIEMSESPVGAAALGGGAMHNTATLRYLDELFGYAMVLTRNQTDAEDLVQETYVRGLKAIGSLQPDSNLKGWLFTILRNTWLNQLRQVRAAPRIIELDTDEGTADLAVATSKDPHALYVEAMERDLVREAILLLPLEFREIILLREYEELSYQEIANLLDCPAGTVMSRLARARSKLRALLLNVLPVSVHARRPEASE